MEAQTGRGSMILVRRQNSGHGCLAAGANIRTTSRQAAERQASVAAAAGETLKADFT
jgi:hypothetical protein